MDPVSNGVSIAPPEPFVGDKRPFHNGEDCQLVVPSPKKPRTDVVSINNLKKVAELVLVLATMGNMRAGRSPTATEVDMIAEAREMLTDMCQGFCPKEVFPTESFEAVIEDLGLTKVQEQNLGFRPPKMSIAEKLLLTKRKMEKSEEFSLHSAPYSPQRPQTNLGLTDKSAGFQPASPLGNVSAVKSNTSSLPYQLTTSEVRPPSKVSTGLPSSHLGRVSSSRTVERSQFRLDGRSNGAAPYSPQVQANTSGDHTTVKTPSWSVQPQSVSSAKTGSDNKIHAHNSVKISGATDISESQAATSKPFITQTTSANPPTIYPHLQGRNFVQAPPSSNIHIEIGKIIQKLLQPQFPQQPTWTPPSRDYMNKAVTCQMCKLTINEVECLLVCDACEKSYHLKCLQWNNAKTIPRGEWHCGKCLALSNGKPLPPKYGRVMRNSTTAPKGSEKVSSNAPAVHSLSDKKVGTSEEKVNEQRIANDNSAFGTKKEDTREMQGNNDGNFLGTCPNKTSEAACVSPVELSVKQTREEKLVTEKNDTAVNSFGDSEAIGNSQNVNQTGVQNSQETLSSPSWHDANVMVKESLDCSQNCGIEQDNNQANNNPVQTCGEHYVEWIGNIYQVVDEKTHYKSCCINGVVYKVDDHALFRWNHKLMPSKLQAMWEDNKTRLKWVSVNRCYMPEDLPAGVGRPCAPESDEVYDSNHESTVMAKLIEGPCEVLHPNRYIKESERRRSDLGPEESNRLHPLFLCKWFYDETKGLFRDVSC